MNEIWANRLIAGTQTFEKCKKAGRAEAVKAILGKRVAEGEITAECYEEITGEKYSVKE